MNDNEIDSSDDDLLVQLSENPILPPDCKLERYRLIKPSFCPKPYGWNIDHVYNLNEKNWLFCMNMNTRYLVVYPIPENSVSVRNALTDLCNRFTVTSIKSDKSSAYTSNIMKDFYIEHEINFYARPTTYVNTNRLIDRVILTIRLYAKKLNTDDIQTVVDYYNNRKHRIINCPPAVMMEDPTGELNYIARCQRELEAANQRFKELGILDYKKNDIVMIHVDESKTKEKFKKKNRVFHKFGKFYQYLEGNVIVNTKKKFYVVPMYCTRPISQEWTLNKDWKPVRV